MAAIPTPLTDIIARYISLVRRRHPLKMAYLFGSQATGNASEWSDIDLALISSDFASDPTRAQIKLMQLAARIDWRIEPHLFSPGDFNLNHPLVAEIRRTGIRIHLVRGARRVPNNKQVRTKRSKLSQLADRASDKRRR
jgi:predicted nucleotidyltransferase